MTLNGPKSLVNWSLKIWDFHQTGIGFLDLFKGSLGKKGKKTWKEKGVPHWSIFLGLFRKNLLWSLSEDKGAPLHVNQPIQMKDISVTCFIFLWTKFYFLEHWCSLAMNTQFISWVILFLIFLFINYWLINWMTMRPRCDLLF